MTEETIDVERMMLGIDDAGAHVVNWINCSDRMPPDNETYIIIVKSNVGVCVSDGRWHNMVCKGKYEWIPYDEATWKELNEK